MDPPPSTMVFHGVRGTKSGNCIGKRRLGRTVACQKTQTDQTPNQKPNQQKQKPKPWTRLGRTMDCRSCPGLQFFVSLYCYGFFALCIFSFFRFVIVFLFFGWCCFVFFRFMDVLFFSYLGFGPPPFLFGPCEACKRDCSRS